MLFCLLFKFEIVAYELKFEIVAYELNSILKLLLVSDNGKVVVMLFCLLFKFEIVAYELKSILKLLLLIDNGKEAVILLFCMFAKKLSIAVLLY